MLEKDLITKPNVITFIRVFVSCGNFLFSLSFVVKEKKSPYIDGKYHTHTHTHTHTRTVRQTDRKIDSNNPE